MLIKMMPRNWIHRTDKKDIGTNGQFVLLKIIPQAIQMYIIGAIVTKIEIVQGRSSWETLNLFISSHVRMRGDKWRKGQREKSISRNRQLISISDE